MEVPEFAQPPQGDSSAQTHAGGMFSHPYILTLLGSALVVLVGVVFVLSHGSAAVGQAQPSAWGGLSGIPSEGAANYPAPAPGSSNAPQPEQTMATSESDITLTNTIQMLGSDQSARDAAASDLDALLAQITSSATPALSAHVSASSSDSLIADAYALIPTGLVATTSMSQAKLTKTQSALYQYGNDAGSIIQTYEYTHQNVAEILKDQASDRTDPDKSAAVQAIGKALTSVGSSLLKLQDVPAVIAPYNDALGKSYQEIGGKLALVAEAQTDDQFLSAVQTYDAAEDTFSKNYVALATYLSAAGVTFSPDDSGSVFSFTPVNF